MPMTEHWGSCQCSLARGSLDADKALGALAELRKNPSVTP